MHTLELYKYKSINTKKKTVYLLKEISQKLPVITNCICVRKMNTIHVKNSLISKMPHIPEIYFSTGITQTLSLTMNMGTTMGISNTTYAKVCAILND